MDENDRIPQTLAPAENRLKKVAEFANKITHIQLFQEHCSGCPRYIHLRPQEMFDNLVDLYAIVFLCKWNRYESRLNCCSPPTGVPLHVYAARCYISMWFIDLYVSNRNAVRELCPLAFLEHFQGELVRVSSKYDRYLALLNASILPTCLKRSLDNWLYIPVIVESPDVSSPNPFGIDNFTPLKMCYKFALIMNASELGHSISISISQSSDAMGRPWWLFDWHCKSIDRVQVCSWFPPEGNYDLGDVTLAGVLGTACTANLGPRDVDEWQYFADGIVPRNASLLNYERVSERKFYGSHEVRTIEIDADFSLTRAVAAGGGNGHLGEESQQDYPMTPRFRLVDWLYHRDFDWHTDQQTRCRVLRLFHDHNIPESLW